MKKEQIFTLVFFILIFFESMVSGQVNQEIRINTKMLPGPDKYSNTIVVVLDNSGFSDDTSAANAFKNVKTRFQDLLQKYGDVKVGPETGFGRESLQAIKTTLDPELDLIYGMDLAIKIKKLQAIFDPVRSVFLNPDFPTGIPYIELSFAKSEEVSKFLLCVLLDYQVNVAEAIKLPPYLKTTMAIHCSSRITSAELLAYMLVLDEQIKYTAIGNAVDWETDREYFSPQLLETDIVSCQKQLFEGLQELVDAGWSHASDATTAIEDCLVTAYDQFFALNDLVKKGFQALVLSNSKITPYYRSLLAAMLDAKDKVLTPDLDLLEKSLKDGIRKIPSIEGGYTVHPMNMDYFNIAEFNRLAKDKQKTPDQLLDALFSQPKGPESDLRNEFAKASVESVEAYLLGVRDFLLKSCDFDRFNASCLREGLANLEGNQTFVRFTYGLSDQVIWSGYLFFKPSFEAQ